MNENALSLDGFIHKYREFVEKYGLSGSVIKIIAIVTMLIDHVGAGIFENWMYNSSITVPSWMYNTDIVMRGIGRIAFPIFCFMLVEGYVHTRNVWKYFLRLVVFGVIAEVPFDLGIFRRAWHAGYQNVFWTLALGVLMMILMDKAAMYQVFKKKAWLNRVANVVFDIMIFLAVSVLAVVFKTDYNVMGITTILLVFAFRNNRFRQLVALAAACWLVLDEIPALLCLIPLALYNGKRGFGMKYFFYAFYPVHLMLIWVAGLIIGLP